MEKIAEQNYRPCLTNHYICSPYIINIIISTIIQYLMSTILKTLFCVLIFTNGLYAQCDLKVDKEAFKGKQHSKHVETHSDLVSMSDGVLYSGISNFYDGSPQFKIQVCLDSDHYSISKDDEVTFYIKGGESIKRKNLLRTGAKKKQVGSGTYRCATYTIPIDNELNSVFLKDEKKCALEKLEVTHSLGTATFKVKKKYANVLGQHVKCITEALENS